MHHQILQCIIYELKLTVIQYKKEKKNRIRLTSEETNCFQIALKSMFQ